MIFLAARRGRVYFPHLKNCIAGRHPILLMELRTKLTANTIHRKTTNHLFISNSRKLPLPRGWREQLGWFGE